MKKALCLYIAVILILGFSAFAQEKETRIQSQYDKDKDRVREWTDALENEQSLYIDISTIISKKLLTYSITCKELSQSDKRILIASCGQIKNLLCNSIEYAWTRDFEWTDILFPVGNDDATRDFILSITDSRYQDLLDSAESLGGELENAMTSIVEDNYIMIEERDTIENNYLSAMHLIQNGISTSKHRNDHE